MYMLIFKILTTKESTFSLKESCKNCQLVCNIDLLFPFFYVAVHSSALDYH